MYHNSQIPSTKPCDRRIKIAKKPFYIITRWKREAPATERPSYIPLLYKIYIDIAVIAIGRKSFIAALFLPGSLPIALRIVTVGGESK